ncbi:MAG: adenosine kinase [Prevotellaceae bacterium]|jgi:sugar/nucleoside kinase (ribokinase family)|nr:adenosine kinase [Prevotellaceae bacterium]
MKKILGLGNPLVDVLTKLKSDEFLQKFSLPKGSMQLVNSDISGKIAAELEDGNRFLVTGGSASNTINGLAKLGVTVGFAGKTGNDEIGAFFQADSEKNGVKSHLIQSDSPSGVCISLISPDGERTMATCLGAACEITADDLREEIFSGYDYCHIEGYWVLNRDLILNAMQMAKKGGLKISMDLSSYNVVSENLDFLKQLVRDYVDILFANEEEAKAFTGKEPREALDEIAGICEIAVVKVGAQGSYIKKGEEMHEVAALPGVTCLDTTGAGDLYASGFLYGLTEGLPLQECGKTGSLVSGNIIQVIGTKLDDEKWEEIKLIINSSCRLISSPK